MQCSTTNNELISPANLETPRMFAMTGGSYGAEEGKLVRDKKSQFV